MADSLYARLNARGHKQFKGSDVVDFEVSYPDYSKIGLPAHKAALDGNVSCLRDYFVSKHQKDEGVPSRDVNGATPLHLATRTNRIDVIRWILRYTDLSPLTAAKHGETPAHVAAAQGHVDCLKVMVSAEGKSDIKNSLATLVDNSGFTALHLAIVKFRNECAKVLISELGAKGVGALNESGITAAHVAASAGNVDILKLLGQKHKKLMTQQAADGTTPAYFAAQEGRLDALKFLATKLKCDLTTPSNDGLKPIHAASQCGHTHIIKFIVSQLGNSSVFAPTQDGATPLHFAASSGQLKTARWLINSDVGGSLITSKDKNGDTAAHDAADNGQTEMLKLLLESGADLYAINSEGNTPYSLALSGQDSEIANFVMTYASKSPQKQDTGPSQMTIYDLQGDVDVVNIESTATGPVQSAKDEPDLLVPVPMSEPVKSKDSSSGKKASKKGKKDKGDKKKKSVGGSLLDTSATTQALQSLDKALAHEQQNTAAPDNDLDMTEEEMAQFHSDPKPAEINEEIVVRYTEKEQLPHVTTKAEDPQLMTSNYSTVSELAENEERKKKKRGRKLSKSIQNALKPGKKKVTDSNKQTANVKEAFSGPEMGFKPQFKSNPLQRMPGAAPPTPPPTPATGASIAPSEETPQSNLDDVDEEEDDGNPYDSYSAPDVIIRKVDSKDKEEKEIESENKKLLGDALDDLSGDDTPPQVQEKSQPEEPVASNSGASVGSDSSSPMLKPGIWPPPSEDARDREPDPSPPMKPAQPTVLKKWQPKEWKKEDKQPPPSKLDINSWLKNVKQGDEKPKEKPNELEVLKKSQSPVKQPVGEESPPEPTRKEDKSVIEEVSATKFVALKPVKKESNSSKSQDSKNALSFVKLKKAEGKQGAVFTKPETELASGASEELLKFLKGRQN